LKACNATNAIPLKILSVQPLATSTRPKTPWLTATAWNQPLRVTCASRFPRAVRTPCTPKAGRPPFVDVRRDQISVSVGAAATTLMSSVSMSRLVIARTEMAATRLIR